MKENRYLFRVTPKGQSPGTPDDLIVEVYNVSHARAEMEARELAIDCGFGGTPTGDDFKIICIKVGTVSPDGRYHQ